MQQAQAAKILTDAAVLLERKGWTQGVCYDAKHHRLDMVGAIAHAAGVKISVLAKCEDPLTECAPAVTPAVAVAVEELEARLNADITEWNDLPHRTEEQVLVALRAAANAITTRATITDAFLS